MSQKTTLHKYAALLATVIALLSLGITFMGSGGTLAPAAEEVSYYATYTVPPDILESTQKLVETVKTVAEAVVILVETEEPPENVLQAIRQAPIEELLIGAPVTPEVSDFDKNNDGVVDVVDMVKIYAEAGIMKEPPKVKKEFAETLLELLKRIYGPNLENFPSAEGKLWILALYKTAE